MNIDGKAEKQYTKNYETTFEERVKSCPPEKKEFSYARGVITDGKYSLHIGTNGSLRKIPAQWQRLRYTEDAKDGRADRGYTGCSCRSSSMWT